MHKILLGIPAMLDNSTKSIINEDGLIIDTEVDYDNGMDYWCDFSVEQDLDRNIYLLIFETNLGFDTKEGCRKWIEHCLDTFTEYMQNHNYNCDKELNLYDVFTEGMNVNTEFTTLEDTYAFMKFVVNGFHGDGLYSTSFLHPM